MVRQANVYMTAMLAKVQPFLPATYKQHVLKRSSLAQVATHSATQRWQLCKNNRFINAYVGLTVSHTEMYLYSVIDTD